MTVFFLLKELVLLFDLKDWNSHSGNLKACFNGLSVELPDHAFAVPYMGTLGAIRILLTLENSRHSLTYASWSRPRTHKQSFSATVAV